MCLAINPRPCSAPLHSCRAADRVDVNPPHRRQVDHQPVVDRRSSGNIVTSAPHRDFEAELIREPNRIDDIGRAAATCDQCRALVDQAVMDPPRLVIGRIGGLQQLPQERAYERQRRVGYGGC